MGGPTRHNNLRAPFLVLAHHRSGSNFLNDLLQAHPHIECINEPLSMHTGYFRECDLATWTGTDLDADMLHRSLAEQAPLRLFLHELRAYLLQSHIGRVIGFKETVLFGKLEWLKAFIPSLKIIFLKRDPRAIVSSVLRSDLSDFWRYEELVPPAFARLFPNYPDRSVGDDKPARAAELVAMSVVLRYELARRELGLFQHRVVTLEELMRDPGASLGEMTDLLGLAPHERQLQFVAERQMASRGGAFSSFRKPDDVTNAWERHLDVRQLQAIDDVLRFACERTRP